LPLTVNSAAAAVAVVDGCNSSHRRWKRQPMVVAAMGSLPPLSMPMMG
jgi:hypothetical protein